MTTELSIIVPAYNEADRIDQCIGRLAAFLRARPGFNEIIIVANGCTDNTLEKIKPWLVPSPLNYDRVMCLTLPQRGKGAAIRKGMEYATGKYRMIMDADLSISPVAISEYISMAKLGGYDIVIGDRTHPHSVVSMPLVRRLSGRIFYQLTGLIVGLWDWKDTQCGFKLFTDEAARTIFTISQTDGWAADVEWLLLAKWMGYRVKAIPVIWRHNPNSRIRLLQDSIHMTRELFEIRNLALNFWQIKKPGLNKSHAHTTGVN